MAQDFLSLPHGIPSDDTFRRVFKDETRGSLKGKRAGWDNEFLFSLLEHLNPK